MPLRILVAEFVRIWPFWYRVQSLTNSANTHILCFPSFHILNGVAVQGPFRCNPFNPQSAFDLLQIWRNLLQVPPRIARRAGQASLGLHAPTTPP